MPLLLALAALAGVLLPVQAGINAQLRRPLGSPLAATFVSFLIGTIAVLLVLLALRPPLALSGAWERSSWWHWTGGLLGAAYVLLSIVLAPRLGAATLIAAVVAGQMITSLVLDQFGLVGFPFHPITPVRIAGAMLIIAGVLLIQR
ncbi:MAG TPA: DMT family transporter [Gemmatimonadales bacterium]|nr:DMT family transporter [Gemmatimonadales bacterium]